MTNEIHSENSVKVMIQPVQAISKWEGTYIQLKVDLARQKVRKTIC